MLVFPGERKSAVLSQVFDVDLGRLTSFENGLDDIRRQKRKVHKPAGMRAGCPLPSCDLCDIRCFTGDELADPSMSFGNGLDEVGIGL